ncbi:MAG: molybdopterin-synthase adenylyltransferase MoeB [Helicobacteraceae bacterium]|jgi:adenylyltransferase/sulfurtransferase|nr:molybdopterin-synthase adenylyltransferase MoeB [Helicobacteraceae bacterium]
MQNREELTREEIERYSRHLLLGEVGLEGQKRLKAAKVLIVGAGGLGAPIALYLAAAGVGTIGLVDFDDVESSNLQRQVIHSTRDIGRPKVASARDRVKGVNPFINVEIHNVKLSSANALAIIKDYDIVADGTDNYPTRYLLNDACAFLGKPIVYGSIYQFEGQLSVFYAKEGPCYRCLYPTPPPAGLTPSCAEGGVIGALPGIVGSMQASEVVKLIVAPNFDAQNAPTTMIGRLLLFDAWKMRFNLFSVEKDPNCPVCGANPSITALIDYEEFCGLNFSDRDDQAAVITPKELKRRLDRGDKPQIIDVREPHELAIVKFPGAKSIPIGQIAKRREELDKEGEVVVICKMGTRSAFAIRALKEAGYAGSLLNLEGGINAWSEQVDPSLPTY